MGGRRGSLRGRAAGAYLASAQQDRTEPQQAGLHPDQARRRLSLRRQSQLPRRPGTAGDGRMNMRTVAFGLLLFLVMAGLLVRRNFRREEQDRDDAVEQEESRHHRLFVTAFSVVFVAEWGDLTQLATAALQARYQDPIVVFVAATLALWSVSAI